MELLRCYRCNESKPVEHFAWRRKERGQRDSFCRPCRSAYGKEHYAANRQRYIDQARASKEAIRLERTRFLLEFFKSHPCVDCGESDPVVLEFDHLGDRSFSIGAKLVQFAWQTISTRSKNVKSSALTATDVVPRGVVGR